MQVRIERDPGVCPGGESWLPLIDDMVFIVSAAGVTQEGADCLQDAWGWFIDRGWWRWRGGGTPVTTCYSRVDSLPGGAACEVSMRDGAVRHLLSAEHFTRGSVNGLQCAARDSVRSGWSAGVPAQLSPGQLAG